jgi:uncharacterized repeat protein (TIGR01451 family)
LAGLGSANTGGGPFRRLREIFSCTIREGRQVRRVRFVVPQIEVLEDRVMLDAAANLQVMQTAAPKVLAGDNIAYLVTVTNIGPNAAQNVVLNDTLPSGTTLVSQSQTSGPSFTLGNNGNTVADTLAALLAGQSALLDITAAVSPTVANNTILYNTATADSSTTNPIPNTASDTFATAVQNLAALNVSLTGPATAAAGGNLTYTLTVSNAGPSAAQNVSLTDALPSGATLVGQTQTSGPTFTLSANGNSVSGSISSLAAGASAAFAITAEASANVANNTLLTDSATATASNSLSASAATAAVAQNQAELTVSVSAPAVVTAGDQLTYTISVANNGPQDAQNVTLSDLLPSELTLVSQSQTSGPAIVLGGSGNSISDTIGVLPAGQSASLTLTAQVSATAPSDAPLTNTVSANGTNAPEASATTTTNVQNQATLTVSLDGPDTVAPGYELTYTLTLSNSGPQDAQNVALADSLPAGLTLVSQTKASGPDFLLSTSGNTIDNTIDTLPAGSSATFTITARAGTGLSNNTALTNAATATAMNASAAAAGTTATVQTQANPNLAVSVGGPATAVAGSQVIYTLTIANNGPDDAEGVTLSDTLPAGLTLVSQTQTGGPTFALGSSGSSISNSIATLASGDTATFEVTAQVGT